jgi:hypothetical protein
MSVTRHQFGPADQYDRDLSQVSPLFSASVHGKPRDLITVSGKDGLMGFHAESRLTSTTA